MTAAVLTNVSDSLMDRAARSTVDDDTSAPFLTQPSVRVHAPFVGPQFCINWPWKWPLALLCLATAILRWSELEMTLSSWFYDAASQSWPHFENPCCIWFYRQGTYPTWILLGMSILSVLFSVILGRRTAWGMAGLFVIAVMVLGPGLIINSAFKTHWGRPRPHQVEQFGGSHRYAELGSPGTLPGHNSSFPSGHAAFAYMLLVPAFTIDARRLWLCRAWMFGGLLYGSAMGTVRIIQGGHFLGDVIWSAALVYFSARILAPWLLQPLVESGGSEATQRPSSRHAFPRLIVQR
jgi:lipid A 4'-phosphatase